MPYDGALAARKGIRRLASQARRLECVDERAEPSAMIGQHPAVHGIGDAPEAVPLQFE